MAVPGHHKIAFRFNLPDGDHIAVHNTFVDKGWDKDTKQRSLATTIKNSLVQNPDAKLDENSFVDLSLEKDPQGKLRDMVEQLRREDPNRPLADDMGLDFHEPIAGGPVGSKEHSVGKRGK